VTLYDDAGNLITVLHSTRAEWAAAAVTLADGWTAEVDDADPLEG
jgi:hypothetical protein